MQATLLSRFGDDMDFDARMNGITGAVIFAITLITSLTVIVSASLKKCGS